MSSRRRPGSRRLPLTALARRAAILIALLAPVFVAPAEVGADVQAHRGLARALASHLDRAGLPRNKVGVAVLTRGARPAVVFVRDHNRSLIPASTAKVFTAAAVLDHLGPAHVFTTSITARGDVGPDGTLHGDLVVHGTGDPNLSGRFHDGNPRAILDAFARSVREAGIARVEGALVLDDGPFDRDVVHPSWSDSDRRRWYGAPVGGLAFNDACCDLVVRGGARPGQPAAVTVPSTLGPWRLDNRVTTIARGDPMVGALWVQSGRTLRVQGKIAAGGSYTFSHPVADPLRFFGGAFLHSLEAAGVSVGEGMRPARDAADRRPGRLRVARHGSGMAETLQVMNRRSQNFYASLLFKAAGAAWGGGGSWESGESAVEEMLARRGLTDDGSTRIVDGSGLSLENRTTAATLARLLLSFDSDLMAGPLLYDSLAVPGQEGTLHKRLRTHGLEERLHAKTGTLGRSGVHALAGYVDGREGEPGFVFAILLNTSKGGRSLIDALVEEIARR
jgi:D-alanyl-D-alanine carboxypeptidase/D-alanyl-D-alanine-endopeptidase (penicillin-binding protein 4)